MDILSNKHTASLLSEFGDAVHGDDSPVSVQGKSWTHFWFVKTVAAKVCIGSMPFFKLGYIGIILFIDFTILTGQFID